MKFVYTHTHTHTHTHTKIMIYWILYRKKKYYTVRRNNIIVKKLNRSILSKLFCEIITFEMCSILTWLLKKYIRLFIWSEYFVYSFKIKFNESTNQRINELVNPNATLDKSVKTKPLFVGSPRIMPGSSLKKDRPWTHGSDVRKRRGHGTHRGEEARHGGGGWGTKRERKRERERERERDFYRGCWL